MDVTVVIFSLFWLLGIFITWVVTITIVLYLCLYTDVMYEGIIIKSDTKKSPLKKWIFDTWKKKPFWYKS